MSAGGSTSTVEHQGFDVLASSEAKALLESGKLAGKLIAEDIASALDELDLDASQMDEFYSALEELKIEVVERDEPDAEVEEAREVSTDTLQLFLKDIGKVPLLTAAQEVELAKRIERGEHAAKQAMVEANLRLVVSIAKLPQPGAPVPRPDPGGDDRPRSGGGEVRLPQGLQVLHLRDLVDPAGSRPCARRQGADDPDACARGREAEQDRADGARAARQARPRAQRGRDRSRARPAPGGDRADPAQRPDADLAREAVGDEDESEFGHFLTDETVPLPDEQAEETLRNEALRTILKSLSHRERRVLELRYGLDGEQPRTLDEVGKAFNVTRERIRQIENQGLKKLRALALAAQLRDVA